MSNIDKQALREAAEKATPGPWRRASVQFNGITHGKFSFTKERLEPVIERLEHYATNVKWTNVQAAQDMLTAVDAMRIALASLEAEPVALRDVRSGSGGISKKPGFNALPHGTPIFTAPPAPAPVSVPECFKRLLHHAYGMTMGHDWNKGTMAGHHRDKLCRAVEDCRAAMLQGADSDLQRKAATHDALCEKYNVESLADFVDWQRNHIAELEAAPPAPVGEGETAVMPDYPGYVMTQRECFDAGAKRAVPDGWVACSERMPEKGQKVFYYFDIVGVHAGYYDGDNTFVKENGGGWLTGDVTHWMEWVLPAAPQQEMKP